MCHIVFKGKKYKRAVLNITGNAQFHDILKQVNSLIIPGRFDEHIRYALLELISNSLRAHRKKNISEPVRTVLTVKNENLLLITITDRGGGFDTKALPYNFGEPVETIDTTSTRFRHYREETQYRQFGMGLIIARRLFRNFRVSFYNDKGENVPQRSPDITGTRISMELRLDDAGKPQ